MLVLLRDDLFVLVDLRTARGQVAGFTVDFVDGAVDAETQVLDFEFVGGSGGSGWDVAVRIGSELAWEIGWEDQDGRRAS